MKRYLAFISYRHIDRDQQVSLALLKGLEGYHLPKNSGLPGKRRVFRDADELPTGTDLAVKELYKMLPYVVTIIVLVITGMRNKRENQPPESLGLPYFREVR